MTQVTIESAAPPQRTAVRTFRAGALGASAAVLTAGLWAVTDGASAARDREHLTFFIRDTKQAIVDSPPKGSSQGDLFAFHGVVQVHKGGRQSGRFGGACVQLDKTRGAPSDSSCSVDYVLPGGQLHTELFGANDLLLSGRPVPFAILGGTGKYAGARGDGTIRTLPKVKNNTDADVAINLIDD